MTEAKPMMVDIINLKDKVVRQHDYYVEEAKVAKSSLEKKAFDLLALSYETVMLDLEIILDKHSEV